MSRITSQLVQEPQPLQLIHAQSAPSDNKQPQLDDINPIILLKQPQLFRQTFLKLTKSAIMLYKGKQLQKGLSLFNKAIDMLDLGKNILKDSISKYLKLTIFVNLSYGYQNLRKLQKASRFCERAKEELEKLIATAKQEEQSIQKYLKLSKFLVTLKFQHCAIVSQLQQHEKALQMCKSTLPELKQQLQTMLKYIKQTSSSRILQKKTGQTVQFSRHVHKFAQSMLTDLITFLNQPLKRFHFYHWQKNPQLNEQQVRRKFIPSNVQVRNECKRSILGVSKTSSWMDEFNIGSIMHMAMVTVEEFQMSLPMEEYFFKDKLYEIVILCSLSYFTMATEIRFLEPSKQNQNNNRQPSVSSRTANSTVSQQSQQPNQSSQMGSSYLSQAALSKKSQCASVILKKYGYQQRSEMNKLSQLYHLRSIEMVSRHIQTVIPYLIHIIKSYDKHYLKKKQLQPIAAINEESQLSLLNQSVQEYLPEEKIYNDYMKKDGEKNDDPMEELLLQSQDRHRSLVMSRNKSENQKSSEKTNKEDLVQVKNILDFNNSTNTQKEDINDYDEPNNISHTNNKSNKKNLSKIIQDPKLQSQIHLQSRAHQPETSHQHQIGGGEYLISKRTIMNTVKSPNKKSKNTETKRTKSKSKLNLISNNNHSKSKQITSRERTQSRKQDKTSAKNIYLHRSPQDQKRSVSKSQYQSNKQIVPHQAIDVKKYHSPELTTITESKKRLKTHLSDKSRQKILKKFIGVPHSQYEDQKDVTNPKPHSKNTTKHTEKKPKHHEQQKKKQSKYYTTFDGQKEYRIKHESTTHIKVLYKKKNANGEKEKQEG